MQYTNAVSCCYTLNFRRQKKSSKKRKRGTRIKTREYAIGTGWSTNIPQFNPLDIINNIKCLMNGEPVIPMNPWYRGFRGNIIRLGDNKWLVLFLLFLIALSGFLIACIGAAATSNFYVVVSFRIMQGFFGGALMPLMFSCIYILFTPKQLPFALSLTATVGVSSIAFGPAIGGFLTEMISWQWMFLYNLPIGIIILILAYFFIDLQNIPN